MDDHKKQKLKDGVNKPQYLMLKDYSNYLNQAVEILKMIEDMNDKQIKGKECNQLLGLVFNLMVKLKEICNCKIENVEQDLTTIQELRIRATYQKNIKIINLCLKQLKKTRKKRKGEKKRSNIKDIREKMKSIECN